MGSAILLLNNGGKMNIDTLYSGNVSFEHKNEKLYLVGLLSSKRHIHASRVKHSGGEIKVVSIRIPVLRMSINTLKEIDIWDKLEDKTRKEIEDLGNNKVQEVNQSMDHAKKHRRNRYEGVPREVICVSCGKKQTMNPAIILAKVDKECTTIEKWVAKWACQECCPTKRGRQANPAFAHLPKELVCKCGNKVGTSPSAIVATAKRKNITPEAYVKGYQCQSCNRTIGRKKGQKI